MPDTTDANAADKVRSMLRTAVDDSRVVTLTNASLDPVRHTTRHLADYTRKSFLYRWLTTEPDPEVVVIDLRETYTVGPLIAIIDSFVDRVAAFDDRIAPYWSASTLSLIFDWCFHQLHRVADTRIGRTIRALLEPPKPPEEERD